MNRIRRKLRNRFPRPPLWRSPPAPTQIIFCEPDAFDPTHVLNVHFNNPVAMTGTIQFNIWANNNGNEADQIAIGADGRSISLVWTGGWVSSPIGWDNPPVEIVALSAPFLPSQVFEF